MLPPLGVRERIAPVAAGDFYFAINATFRFIFEKWGEQGLIDYWETMAREYHAPISARFREGGLPEVASFWRRYFDHEPGGDVRVVHREDAVEIVVRDCPAIRWLEDSGRDVMPLYCRHCHYTATVIAGHADMSFHLEGGGGSCRQTFRLASATTGSEDADTPRGAATC